MQQYIGVLPLIGIVRLRDNEHFRADQRSTAGITIIVFQTKKRSPPGQVPCYDDVSFLGNKPGGLLSFSIFSFHQPRRKAKMLWSIYTLWSGSLDDFSLAAVGTFKL